MDVTIALSQPPVLVLILGMHRSGTSALAGGLEGAGLYLGDEVNRCAPHNVKGNMEQPDVWQLHDRILSRAGASWQRPRVIAKYTRGETRGRDAVLQRLTASKAPVVGIKDPRAVFCLELWTSAVRAANPVRLVGTVRHPLSVARSLFARNGIAFEEAIDLWTLYNSRLLALHRGHPFPLVNFSDAETLAANTCSAAERLGLGQAPKPDFHDAALRCWDVPSITGGVGSTALTLWRELARRAAVA